MTLEAIRRHRIARADLIEHLREHAAEAEREEQSHAERKRGLQRPLFHDERKDIATIRPERHADSDLARPAGHRIRFHAIHAHNREKQRDPAEDAEENRAKTHRPKPDVFFHDIFERLDAQNRHRRIDLAQRLAQRRHHRADRRPIVSREAHLENDAAAVGLRQRRENPARHFAVQNLVPMFAHDPDDREIVRRAVAWRQGVAQMLAERVLLREKSSSPSSHR